MSLLTLIQNVADDIGLNRPTSIIGSGTKDIRQLVALANKEGEELVNRYMWQFRFNEVLHTTVALALQGTMTAIAGNGFKYIVNDTIWDRDQSLPILGPIAARDWQALEAFPVTGPYTQFRIQNDSLFFDPIPTAGITVAFEYISESFCKDVLGNELSQWGNDTDVGICDEKIMRLGIIWRWFQRKKLDYNEDFVAYEKRVADAMAQDGGKQMQRLDGRTGDRVPGIFVPEGNWSL